jgi:hypothetical protein
MIGQRLVIGVIIWAIGFGLLVVWGLRKGQKFREKIPPSPPEASSSERLKWENQVYDEIGDITRWMPPTTKVFIIVFGLSLLFLMIGVIGILVSRC